MAKTMSCIAVFSLILLSICMQPIFAQGQGQWDGNVGKKPLPPSSSPPPPPPSLMKLPPRQYNQPPPPPPQKKSLPPPPPPPRHYKQPPPPPPPPQKKPPPPQKKSPPPPPPPPPQKKKSPPPPPPPTPQKKSRSPPPPQKKKSPPPPPPPPPRPQKKSPPPPPPYKKPSNDAMTNYSILERLTKNGQEQAYCKAKGDCHHKTLVCPIQCPVRKPKKNKKQKGCLVDCSSKCEVTCRRRRPHCHGYGSLCYDPRFVGGDGVMFYFHGAKGGNFAIVSDEKIHINAHFIGSRPQGRTRDFTWVQALAVMFDSHTLVLAATRVSHWDDNVDALIVTWDGNEISIPTTGDAEWRVNSEETQVVVERTDDANSVRVEVTGLLEMFLKVTPIGQEENRVHNYQLPADDAFAHLETQFKFLEISELVDGVLGKTYRHGYVSPVKSGVPMPMVGGEDKYQTPSLYSTVCKACRFQRPSGFTSI